MKHSRQMSESLELGIVLAMAGGFMDTYSYICRDQVFANAQTGNMLLLGINVAEGNWAIAKNYLFPVVAFMIGITIADLVRIKSKRITMLHWRQIAVVCEAIILGIVCTIPYEYNLIANSMTSLACGIQVESFRKIKGNGIATTMCIGNLRSATQHICDYWNTKDKKSAQKGMLYYGIIFSFIMGAILGNECIKIFEQKAILLCSAILVVAFIMMFVDKEQKIIRHLQTE